MTTKIEFPEAVPPVGALIQFTAKIEHAEEKKLDYWVTVKTRVVGRGYTHDMALFHLTIVDDYFDGLYYDPDKPGVWEPFSDLGVHEATKLIILTG